MDKPKPVRNTKTQKPKMKLQIKLPPNRKVRRQDIKRNRRINYQGYSYGIDHGQKGACGKCKYLKAKEDSLKLSRQLKSVKPVLKEEVYGERKIRKQSVDPVLKTSRVKPE